MLSSLKQQLSSILDQIPIPGIGAKKTDKGLVILVTGSIITPTRIFPLNSLATVTNIIEDKNRIFLIIIGVFLVIMDINFGMKMFKSSFKSYWPFILALLATIFVAAMLLRTPRTGLRLEASSGTSEIILSKDRDFIVTLRQKILEAASQKVTKVSVFNVSQAEINVKGDAAFDKATIKKVIADSFDS